MRPNELIAIPGAIQKDASDRQEDRILDRLEAIHGVD